MNKKGSIYMKSPFIFEAEEDNLKYYITADEKFSITERPDGFFLLYQLNEKKQRYDWTETYHRSMEECEMEMNKLRQE